MQTVLVTGASRGLGAEFVRQYAAEGSVVYAACRQPEAAGWLGSIPGVVPVTLDVGDARSVAELARQLARTPLDLVICNAGIYGPRDGSFGHTDFDGFAEVLRIDTLGPLRVAEALMPNLVAGGARKLVGITSLMGSIGDNRGGGAIPYRAAKAALNAAFHAAAIDLAPQRVTVLLLHPGWVRTDMGGPSASLSAAESAAGLRGVLDRVTSADNGQFLNYDGGHIPW